LNNATYLHHLTCPTTQRRVVKQITVASRRPTYRYKNVLPPCAAPPRLRRQSAERRHLQ